MLGSRWVQQIGEAYKAGSFQVIQAKQLMIGGQVPDAWVPIKKDLAKYPFHRSVGRLEFYAGRP